MEVEYDLTAVSEVHSQVDGGEFCEEVFPDRSRIVPEGSHPNKQVYMTAGTSFMLYDLIMDSRKFASYVVASC